MDNKQLLLIKFESMGYWALRAIGGYINDDGELIEELYLAKKFKGDNAKAEAKAFANKHGYEVDE